MTEPAAALSNSAQKEISDALAQSLADTVVATMLAQNFHWNVKGMSFGSLHALFMEIYEDHFVGQDDLAERMRALDVSVSATLAGMVERSDVKEHAGAASAKDMIAGLLEAQEVLAAGVAKGAKIAADHDDGLTEDLLIARGRVHEKFAWMLRAHLG